MTKIADLKYAPDWLKAASVLDEDVEIVNGSVIWKDGIWRGGTWKDGTWKGGIWRGGTWKDGTWLGGLWLGGIWEDGTWRGGTWRDGIWRGGTWRGGIWRGGTWVAGYQAPVRCKWSVRITPDYQVKVGCKVKTIEEWEAWLDSDEEFETPRSSPEFARIRNAIKVACLSAKLEKELL
jgi:hypothetical protein